ncbi:2-amino-4-hydroxy-6-hydroxymethyldihydropteridine diphosphokinase [Alkalimarinus coralli]|uniref:2-amino-4-hydroxy-6- hydroxymethyldihydropteridine diphosphokinase n=1 Tax=Alkalimarinus coralli TaxID=2935863 RepID=UPI00202AC2BD|nr:2-amino-4-hydroxy-6-hydroxymethyldihydropteridine diphosphokinase [Alkalimarinus coralli]
MAKVYVSIGSNIDRELHVTVALDALQDYFGELQVSSVFESEAVGFEGDCFLNLVAGFETDLSVGELSRLLKQIESDNGRIKNAPKFCSRTLDIDILTYDDRVGETDGVDLPRNEILENAFVLWPLAELAAGCAHPKVGRTYSQLWAEFDRSQTLRPIEFFWQGEQVSPMKDSLAP